MHRDSLAGDHPAYASYPNRPSAPIPHANSGPGCTQGCWLAACRGRELASWRIPALGERNSQVRARSDQLAEKARIFDQVGLFPIVVSKKRPTYYGAHGSPHSKRFPASYFLPPEPVHTKSAPQPCRRILGRRRDQGGARRSARRSARRLDAFAAPVVALTRAAGWRTRGRARGGWLGIPLESFGATQAATPSLSRPAGREASTRPARRG